MSESQAFQSDRSNPETDFMILDSVYHLMDNADMYAESHGKWLTPAGEYDVTLVRRERPYDRK